MKNARDSIVKAALKLFAAKGYAASSIREICEEAGITKPVLYYHFKNKEHLYQELMLDIFNTTKKNLLRLEKSHGSVREKLKQFVHAEFKDTIEDPYGIRLVFRMMFSPEEGYPYFNFVEEYLRERKIITRCIESIDDEMSQKNNPETTASAIMGMMLVRILEYMFTGRKTLTKKKAHEVIDCLLPVVESDNKPNGKEKD